jgi:hypothetical protein
MAVVKRKMPVGAAKKTRGVVESAGAGEYTLPTERSVPSTRLQDFTILLFGEKKIGKTDLTAQFPDTIHLMTEPGGKAQSIYQVPINRWQDFIGYVKLLEKDKGKARRFITASTDTADLLYQRCTEYVCAKLGIEHPSEEAYGKGWSAVREEFTKWTIRLIASGHGVIFISHATEKEIKMRGGETYNRISPTMAGQARDILEGIVDIWAYYGYDGSRRVLTIRGSDHIGAGHRLKDNFKTPTGEPITEIDMGDSAEEGYANLMAAFNNKYVPKKRKEESDAPVVRKKLKHKR